MGVTTDMVAVGFLLLFLFFCFCFGLAFTLYLARNDNH
jgi:hypothetical protein